MSVALVIGLVGLFLLTATAIVAAQDRRARQHAAKHRKSRLTRLGEPTTQFAAYASQHHRRWFDR